MPIFTLFYKSQFRFVAYQNGNIYIPSYQSWFMNSQVPDLNGIHWPVLWKVPLPVVEVVNNDPNGFGEVNEVLNEITEDTVPLVNLEFTLKRVEQDLVGHEGQDYWMSFFEFFVHFCCNQTIRATRRRWGYNYLVPWIDPNNPMCQISIHLSWQAINGNHVVNVGWNDLPNIINAFNEQMNNQVNSFDPETLWTCDEVVLLIRLRFSLQGIFKPNHNLTLTLTLLFF